jgi:flagellar biosynthesis protein FlhF
MNAVASRFTAPNASEALRRARAALGPDALVLSSRQTSAGVELLAAPAHALERLAAADAAAPAGRMLEELRALAARISQQLGRLAWTEDARRRPAVARLAARLLAAGFGAEIARTIAERVPEGQTDAQADAWARRVIAKNLLCAGPQDEPLARGGVYALIGPTGVGKTTTLAKLAARAVVRHGAQSLGLVSTDGYRIGALDQLRTYARILGVPLHAAADDAELAQALEALSGRRLVLIDTAGVGQRDARLREHLELLARPRIGRILVLSAANQSEAIEDAVLAYRGTGLEGIVLTKLDEARSLGGALDAALRHRLKIIAVADGQRVPEDLHAPVAGMLAERALGAEEPECAAADAVWTHALARSLAHA